MSKRLYISDLDGTLLLPDKTIGKRTRIAVERFIEAGGLFTIATGRSASSAKFILDGLSLSADAITHNGAMTIDLISGIASDVVPMPGPVAARIYFRACEMGLVPVAYARTDDELTRVFYPDRTANDPTRAYLDTVRSLHPSQIDDGTWLAQGPVLSLIILDGSAAIDQLFSETCRGFGDVHASLGKSAYTPGLSVGEVQSIDASKSRSALRLAQIHHLGAEDIVAFGDNMNDLDLLMLAGQAYCPPDAILEVRSIVSSRIGSVSEEGVAMFLETLLCAQ